MRFTSIASLLALAAATASATAQVGWPCEGAGYDCLVGNTGIATCDGRNWRLAAHCGGCEPGGRHISRISSIPPDDGTVISRSTVDTTSKR
ncbi:hypothetical protein Cob_v007971 [Colletotrichum orbiculare MAFF 240422]|uniref:Uncharacterized protein n=1 Tax=Colletotrichum orbiculare (strain 104-T / ATCC 96160 / CBS 514.97 / LARS 414 / MAFF 240422) TaxID=1213857 RepID=A0A484FM79_COLOR|nr:hypothetical protein Cob_v007971 [Colletotrichum orbiculare MAFF 240422]